MAQPLESYPVEEAKAAISFLREVSARFESNPSVHTEFYALLTSFGKGEITDSGAVATRAEALLHGQPDLIARFNAFLAPKPKIELAEENITAAKRRGKKDDHHRRTSVAAGHAKARSDLYGQADKRDDALDKALQFLQLVNYTDVGLYNSLVALMDSVKMDRGMDAHEIYALAKDLFGQYTDLLRGFTEFLPAEHNPSPSSAEGAPEEHRRTSKRKPTPSAVATDADKPSRAKKPRADDCKKQHALTDGSEITEYCDAPAQDDDVAVAFRKAWVFETEYSKLVATIRQAERLQKERARGASSSSSHVRCAFEDLFPTRECRGFLECMYKHRWKDIQEALEDDKRTDLALATIMVSLRRKEDEFVKEAMARRDVTRVYDRLKKLVTDQVRAARENQRH